MKLPIINTVCLTLVWVFFAGVLGTSAPAQEPLPTFEEIVGRLVEVNEALSSFKARQDIEVRILFIRYRVASTVYAARPARYRVEVHNMPRLLRRLGNIFSFAGRPEDVIKLYAPRRVEWRIEGKERRLYLDLVKREDRANPQRVEALIDPEQWLFSKMSLHYEWGTVDVNYAFGVIEGFFLPSAINVRMSAYPISAKVTYRDYELNVPLADSLFSSR